MKFREVANIFIASFGRQSIVEEIGLASGKTIPVEAQVELRMLKACSAQPLSPGEITDAMGHGI